MLFERISASKDKDEVLALGKRGQEVSVPSDVVKDPVVLRSQSVAVVEGHAGGF